jgi:ATP-binding cassette, subfamily G (WHITE), member 2, PDR
MLEITGAAPGSYTDIDWFQTWRGSPEYKEVHRHLDQLKEELPVLARVPSLTDDKAGFREFAAPFAVQQWEVTKRVFEQYWRTPSYIYSKASLCIFSVRSSLSPEVSN